MKRDEEFEGFESPLMRLVDFVLARYPREELPPEISSEMRASTEENCPTLAAHA